MRSNAYVLKFRETKLSVYEVVSLRYLSFHNYERVSYHQANVHLMGILPCWICVCNVPSKPLSDVPLKFIDSIIVPRNHDPDPDDVICLVKQGIADKEITQALTVMPHFARARLPTRIPETIEARKPTGPRGVKWKQLADKFEEQSPGRIYARAGRYLRDLADGRCAVGKTPEPMPWHSCLGPPNLQGVLAGIVPDEIMQSVPLRARWS